MEKKKRLSSRATSSPSTAEDLLASAAVAVTNPSKSSLKSLIWSLSPSSPLISSLPSALHLAVSRSLSSFTSSSPPPVAAAGSTDRSPPPKPSRSGDLDETLDPHKELRCYAYIAHLCVSHPKKPFSPSDLLPAVRSLHDSLVLFEADPALLAAVADLCEDWWKERLPGKESLISQLLPFLISRSLMRRKKVDVRRVCTLREAFLLFDYEDDSIEDTRLLLLRCVIDPVYLKTDEGRKFVAFMLGLNGRLMKEALALLRAQMPFGKKSVLEAYAEILIRAWKGLEGEMREEMEEGFLQGLIEGAVHARSRSLAASVRRVLGGFVEQRVTNGVEKLLFRLAEPVLFRSLQVANSNVRLNALHLLLDLFPLEDPDVTKEVKDILLGKQFYLLERLLVDDCLDIRAVAVEGSCRILHQFWEVIPPSTITNILTKIIGDISQDMCTEVRVSTVNGIIYLVGNPQSHEILKVLVPRLGSMFSDRVLSVRVAVADLLLAIRDFRTFQFHKVVSLDTLMSSLANDHHIVAQKVTKLLIPSYFPSNVTPKEACSRCITLIKRFPIAGARFCEFAFLEGSPLKSLVEVLRVSSILAVSPKDLKPDQIDGFFAVSANVCRMLMSRASCRETVFKLFSGEILKHMFVAAGSYRARTAVLTIASFFSPDDLAGLHDQIMALLKECWGLSEKLEMQEFVKEAHKLIYSHGWFDELFDLLTDIVQAIASSYIIHFGLEMPQQGMQTVKKKKVKLPRKSSVRHHSNTKGSKGLHSSMLNAEDDYAMASAIAWQIQDLLNGADTRNAILRSPSRHMVFSSLMIISQVGIEQHIYLESLDISPVMAYTILSVHMALQNVNSTVAETLGGGDKNDSSQPSIPSPRQTELDQSLNHLLSCFEKLFKEPFTAEFSSKNSRFEHAEDTTRNRRSRRKEALASASNPTEDAEHKTCFTGLNAILNVVKLVTSILKVITDASMVGIITDSRTRCIRFISAYVQRLISFFREIQNKKSCKEGDLNDMLAHLRSFFTYAAKLLHLVFQSSTEAFVPHQEVFHLSSDLLDLITSIELYLGSTYASVMFSVIKQWLPILILGLASKLLAIEPKEGNSKLGDFCALSFPRWLTILSKTEVSEVCQTSQDKQDNQPEVEMPVFKQLMELLILLLKKGNTKILEAVCGVFITGMEHGLEKSDFDLVLGLARFTCFKLLDGDATSCKELEVLPNSLHEISLVIEKRIGDSCMNSERKRQLESARAALRSVS